MKRFHVHLNVADLAASIAFYNRLFAAQPARVEADYAKWMLTDPPVNFAISTRGSQPGLDHLGIQVDHAEDLAALKAQAQSADMALLDEGETTCCYARSDKYWVTDPQGVAWEQFHTLDTIPTFSAENNAQKVPSAQACCAPAAPENAANAVQAAQVGGCCAPAKPAAGSIAGSASAAGDCAGSAPQAATGSCCGPSVGRSDSATPGGVVGAQVGAAAAGGCCAPRAAVAPHAKRGCC